MATNKKTDAAKGTTESAETKKTTTGMAPAVKTAPGKEEVKETEATAQAAAVKRGPAVAKRSARKEAAEMNDPEAKIESALTRTEQYLHNNGKKMLTILIVLVLIVVGFLAYKYLIHGKKQENAGAAMFAAEQLFQQDSFDEALNGDGNNAGFLEIIERYGSTPQGNIARHYAGVCYFKLGDNDNAIKYLTAYKTSKGAPNTILNAMNKGLSGDVRVQRGEYEQAIALYKEAVELSDNSFTSPMFLKKLGLVYAKLDRHADALQTFERIRTDFPGSMEARDIDKYIGVESQK